MQSNLRRLSEVRRISLILGAAISVFESKEFKQPNITFP